jgi:hypothetical protein
MIRVNLLPAEFRRRDRTPLRVFGALIAAVMAVCACGFYYADTFFGELGGIDARLAEVKSEHSGLLPQVKHHDSLVREKDDYSARATTIHEISKSRISWTKKVDELIDITNAGEPREETGEGYLVWFGSLDISQNVLEGAAKKKKKAGAEPDTAGNVRLQGMCATEHASSIVAFLNDLKSNEEFFRDFALIEDPKADLIEQEDQALEPAHVMNFPIAMPVLSRDARAAK